MRRIYESDALIRDNEQPFTPRRPRKPYRPQSFRWINSGAWSDRIIPHAIRCRFLSVTLSVPDRPFAPGEPVPFLVEMTNRLPIPISIKTPSPVLWSWSVDGHEAASRVPLNDPPEWNGRFRFDRGERKRFEKRWHSRFKISDREWVDAEPGEHTIGVTINAIGDHGAGLRDDATVRIVD